MKRQSVSVQWAMIVVGVVLIGFVLLTAAYARLAAPSVGETGTSIPEGDTDKRYFVSNGLATNCAFTTTHGSEQTIHTEELGRSFLQGATFTPPGQPGTLTCDRDTRVVTGGVARLAAVAENEFLIAFPGVVLIAVARVMAPRHERGRRQDGAGPET